ncbi:hypothetical protein EJ08DRAFT_79584 [Tothia fuscella]|uniref:Uncharacterized protein n=1 Tax=Tothia fuscella TaxID=1048955 RepID=A0A9P4U201_9PEZI|nr:hypothetical protein EJ08DRAFT_79584 [Tothia fuscella]
MDATTLQKRKALQPNKKPKPDINFLRVKPIGFRTTTQNTIFVYCSFLLTEQFYEVLDSFFSEAFVNSKKSETFHGYELALAVGEDSVTYPGEYANLSSYEDRNFNYHQLMKYASMRTVGIVVNEKPRPPGCTDLVSIELDEESAMNGQTCLIRYNGRSDHGVYGQVRSDFTSAFEEAASLLVGESKLGAMQCFAAEDGGFLQYDGPHTFGCRKTVFNASLLKALRRVNRDCPSTYGVLYSGKKTVPIFCTSLLSSDTLNSLFQSTLSLAKSDEDPISVGIVDCLEMSRIIITDEPEQLLNPFIGLDADAISTYVQYFCPANPMLSNTTFIMLDQVTEDSRTCIVSRKGIKNGETSYKQLKCTFDGCIEVLSDVWQDYSFEDLINETNVDFGGVFPGFSNRKIP